MAFQKGNFSLVALRVLPGCSDHLKKILQEEWYLMNGWYTLVQGKLVKREGVVFERDLFGDNISITAIVGKNGSGKSSLMELIFRLVNNLDYCMMHGQTTEASWPPLFIIGLCAEVYFESQGQLGCLGCNFNTVSFQWGDDWKIVFDAEHLQGWHDNETRRTLAYITRHFCYSLVVNYAMMSLSPSDYWQEKVFSIDKTSPNWNWLDSIYNKNDGYTAAIGIEPYKGEGVVNLYTQKKLCRARMVGMLIETGKRGVDFFDGYSYHSIELKFDREYLDKHANKPNVDYKRGGRHLDHEIPNLLRKGHNFASVILNGYGFGKNDLNKDDAVVMMAAAYLVFKTLHVAQIYTKYDKYKIIGDTRYFAKNTEAFDTHVRNEMILKDASIDDMVMSEIDLQDLVYDIKKDKSHITQKIRQTLNFLEAVKAKREQEGREWQCPLFRNYDEYLELFDERSNKYAHIYDNSDSIMDYFPPPFFESTIYLKKNLKPVLYGRLSTGEQQFIQTAVSMIYHIKNIISVADKEGAAKYYNINLFVDEIEACFHPEYQQRFIKLFLGMIKGQKLTEKCNINIVVATHSPFILSDIPRENVVYLDEGWLAKEKDVINPFCGNVCDLLRHSFFLKSGFMGEWVKDMVNDLIAYLKSQKDEYDQRGNHQCLFYWNKEKAKAFISMISEPILKGSLMNKYAEVFGELDDALMAWHKAEIERLVNQKTE